MLRGPSGLKDVRDVRRSLKKEGELTGLKREFSLSLLYIDTYPDYYDNNKTVIRIFGRQCGTDKQAVLHVRGYRPYMFVKAPSATANGERDGAQLDELASLIETELSQKKTTTSWKDRLTLCKGMDMYGYQTGECAFVKISLDKSSNVNKLAQRLLAVHKIQPYESHIPYILSFLSDYLLYGMGTVKVCGSLDFLEHGDKRRQSGEETMEVLAMASDIVIDQDSFLRSAESFSGSPEQTGSSSLATERDMAVPSLQRWVMELNRLFAKSGKAVSLSPSIASDREDFVNDATKSEQFLAWLESDNGDEEEQRREPEVSTQECEVMLATRFGETDLKEVEFDLESVASKGSEEGGKIDDDDFEFDESESHLDTYQDDTAPTQILKESSADSVADDADAKYSGVSNIGASSGGNMGLQFIDDKDKVNSQSSASFSGHSNNNQDLESSQEHNRGMAPEILPRSQSLASSSVSVKSSSLSSVSSAAVESCCSQDPCTCWREPKMTPPSRAQVQARMMNFQKYERLFYSCPRDNRQCAHAPWTARISRGAELSTTADLICWAPKNLPPSRASVTKALSTNKKVRKQHKGSGSSSVSASVKVETEDVGSRKTDLEASTFRVMYLDVLACCDKGKTAMASEHRVAAIYAAVYVDESLQSEKLTISPSRGAISEKDEMEMLELFCEFVTEQDPDAFAGWEIEKKSLGYLIQRAETLEFTDFPSRLSRVPNWNNPNWNNGQKCNDPRHRNASIPRTNMTTDIWIPGRHVLNLWRIVRGEITLSNYSLEQVALDLLKVPVPRFMDGDLYDLFRSPRTQVVATDHLYTVVDVARQIVQHLDIITKTAEFTKLLGVDFFSTLTRGSQYRVESVMIRVAKAMNFVLPTPSRAQVSSQEALSQIALTLEPQSGLYDSPVAVLDFRSLYPSVIISHNLCFSTYVGNMVPQAGGPPRFDYEGGGVFVKMPADRRKGDTAPTKDQLRKLWENDRLLITTQGCIFIKQSERSGVLPIMLKEILDTRFFIKAKIKECRQLLEANLGDLDQSDAGGNDVIYGGGLSVSQLKALERVLDARQLALKLLANVTYGYCAASYSGRMPCVGLADSIVLIGKQGLERAQTAINMEQIDGARQGQDGCPKKIRVVYGDTDSLFVHFPDCSRRAAFRFANQIVCEITSFFPYPVKLQFEKIYHPALLVAKKRYCGLKFEKDSQIIGVLESKGLETIRRDSCGLQKRLYNQILLALFTTKDVSKVKHIFMKCLEDIKENNINMRDFVFASQVRVPLDSYTKGLPPSAEVAKRAAIQDKGSMPLHKQRVSFVISEGEGTLRSKARAPEPGLSIDKHYYVLKKIIPPLDRMVGFKSNVRAWDGVRYSKISLKRWYDTFLKENGGLDSRKNIVPTDRSNRKNTMRFYFPKVQRCACCGEKALQEGDLKPLEIEGQIACVNCGKDVQHFWSVVSLNNHMRSKHREVCRQQCNACTQAVDIAQKCKNTTCPVWFIRGATSTLKMDW